MTSLQNNLQDNLQDNLKKTLKNTKERRLTSLVTGGARGIGRAIALRLYKRGDRVIVFDCLHDTDHDVQTLRDLGITYISVDVSSSVSIKQAFECSELIDSQSIDLLVNNAGITRDNLAIRMSEADWDLVLDVNLKGAFLCAQQVLKKMIKQHHEYSNGYIINISSIVGLVGNPGQVNYAASKAGLIAMTKTLAQEYGSRSILVNAIAPGFIQTPMTDKLPDTVKQKTLERIPLKRFGTVDDIAHAVAFLSSGQADYITGQVIEITGGM